MRGDGLESVMGFLSLEVITEEMRALFRTRFAAFEALGELSFPFDCCCHFGTDVFEILIFKYFLCLGHLKFKYKLTHWNRLGYG